MTMQLLKLGALVAMKLNSYIAILASPKHKNACYNSEAIAKIF